MPIDIQIIRACEFIRTGDSGRLDLAASRQALEELAIGCCRKRIGRALLDVREVHAELASTDLALLVQAFLDIGLTHPQRLAMLQTADSYRGGGTFAFISYLRGWTVRVFGDYEEAVSWLSKEEPRDWGWEAWREHENPVRLAHAA